jgi:FkbM family methyltransferase
MTSKILAPRDLGWFNLPCNWRLRHSATFKVNEMQTDLIFDLGMHAGTDTDFYLRKGFRVVSVEADPLLASAAELRFSEAIRDKRLTIVNKAIAARSGHVTLYRNANTIWSTLDTDRADDLVARKGAKSEAIEVEAITTKELLKEFGVPYYLKIDIEGLDTTALGGLQQIDDRPRYVSIESERRDLQSVRHELNIFASLGYNAFKVVPQHRVHKQREPDPPREGLHGGAPNPDSSGLFGEDLSGAWLSQSQALDAYRRPLLNHYLTGSDSLLKSRWLRAVLKRAGFRAGWYDTHGKLSSSWGQEHRITGKFPEPR